MKVTLEFSLPKDADAARLAQNGAAAHEVLRDLRRWLSACRDGDVQPTATEVWDRLHVAALDAGLTLGDWC